jgi:methylamine--corrinoid protein Co-methyltransferase
MIDITEICRRIQTGPVMDAQSFDLDVVFANARAVCKKHDIVYDRETPVPSDDDLADRVFAAAVEFVEATGFWCPDTQTIAKFSADEVLAAVTGARGWCIMGEGKDRYEWTPRLPDSDTPPWFHVGTGIFASDEKIAFDLVKAYASIPQANSISCPAISSVAGRPVQAGTPLEILAAIRGVQISRSASQQAGRPGLAIGNSISTAGTSTATIAASGPQFGLRPSDGWLVGALAEMKYNLPALNKATYLNSWGANVCGESGVLVGGYGGGPAEIAVLNTAYVLLGRLVLHADYHLVFPVHVTRGCSTPRDCLWPTAVSCQAVSRNTRELVWSLGYIAAGPMTKQFFYESGAYIAAAIPSGLSAQTTHPAKAVLTDHVTPMEMLGAVELIEACTGMSRAAGNELALELLAKYEDHIDDASVGCRYQDCYDVATGKPSQEYVDLYGEVKEELRGMGVNYKA